MKSISNVSPTQSCFMYNARVLRTNCYCKPININKLAVNSRYIYIYIYIYILAGLPGFARDSYSIIMSICAFHFYIIYFHGIPQTFDYILTT